MEHPSRITALAVLQRYQLPSTFANARQYLYEIFCDLQFINLYQQYFPDTYARSQKRAVRNSDEAYSPLEAEFIELVNGQLFPLFDEFMIYASSPDERSMTIPVRSLGMDWWNIAPEDLPPVWRLALFLVGEIDGDELAENDPELDASGCSSPLQDIDWSTVTWDAYKQRWEQAAQTLHPAVAHVPLAISLAFHETDNVLLDSTDETPIEDCHWIQTDIDLLAQEYQRANTILDQVNVLLEWLQEDQNNLPTLLSMLKEDQETWISANQG